LTNRGSSIHSRWQQKTFVADIKGPDTLIVFSNDSLVTGQPEGYYFMSTNGQFLSRIQFKNLEYIKPENLRLYRGGIYWDERKQIFIIIEVGDFKNNQSVTSRIAVSDNKAYYKVYTTIEIINHIRYPIFTYDGNYLLYFKADHISTSTYSQWSIMKINIISGNLENLFTSDNINNCIGIEFFDF